MAVYVDNERNVFGGMTLCHMMADTEEELHGMADKIGMARRWFQNHRVPHYDISLEQRGLAVRAGAIEIDRRQTVEVMDKHGWRNNARKQSQLKSE